MNSYSHLISSHLFAAPWFLEQAAAYTLKSYALNLASMMVFAWPFVAYFSYETPYAPILAVVTVAVLLTPPAGWKRPHPYSDQPNNRTARGGPPTPPPPAGTATTTTTKKAE